MKTDYLKRVLIDWQNKANEKLKISYSKGTLYCYGSELATLRLYKKYNSVKRTETRQGYSENLKSFYFCLDLANEYNNITEKEEGESNE